MNTHLYFSRPIIKTLMLIAICGTSACKHVLDVDLPNSKVAKEAVFVDDVTATAAVTGIYQDMIDPNAFSSGALNSVTLLAGLSADELVDFYRADPEVLQFEENNIATDNLKIVSLWNSMYKIIYEANSIIEGVRASKTLTSTTKQQLEGEALFIRAFCHFYLVNLFGGVPVVSSTSYQANATIKRNAVDEVYNQIVEDLVGAKELMFDSYITTGRVRPNKAAAIALLARVYLYKGEWLKAEQEATLVIDNPTYQLVTDLNTLVTTTSNEAIWQIANIIPDFNTWEGYYLTVSFLGPQGPVMNPLLEASFEAGDARHTNWVGSYDSGNGIVSFSYKYKADIFAFGTVEYSTILRLAEQYLIRAEARTMQNKLTDAIKDVDTIRSRASLPKIEDTNPGIQQDDLMEAIDQERKVELFAEWGHRWLDLKRRNKANDILSTIKSGWNTEDQLYPIPALEFERNPGLGDQNAGY